MFVNRKIELDLLDALWRAPGPQLVIVYGRRRVGKTELLQQFARDRNILHIVGDRSPLAHQMRLVSNAFAGFFSEPFLSEQGFANWDAVFSFLQSRIAKPAPQGRRNSRYGIVLDEYPYFVESEQSLSSILQRYWDTAFSRTDILIVLCGSSIGMMESQTLAYRAPLYGRRTRELLLMPMRFADARQFFPDLPFEMSLSLYTIAGGMPAYLRLLNPRHSPLENATSCTLDRHSPLFREVDFLLQQELREPRIYAGILGAIASGSHRFGEICNATGLGKNILQKYLNVLSDMQLIERQVPVTAKRPHKSKAGLYRIRDNFLRFWFSYVYPHRAELELGNLTGAVSDVKKTLNWRIAMVYEDVAADIVRSGLHPLRRFQRVGRWWDANAEIDIVGVNEDTGDVLFGEVKWTRRPIGTDIYKDLRQKALRMPWKCTRRKEHFALFSKAGFTPEMMRLARNEGVWLLRGDSLIHAPHV